MTDGDCCHNFYAGEPSPENASAGLEMKLENRMLVPRIKISSGVKNAEDFTLEGVLHGLSHFFLIFSPMSMNYTVENIRMNEFFNAHGIKEN